MFPATFELVSGILIAIWVVLSRMSQAELQSTLRAMMLAGNVVVIGSWISEPSSADRIEAISGNLAIFVPSIIALVIRLLRATDGVTPPTAQTGDPVLHD